VERRTARPRASGLCVTAERGDDVLEPAGLPLIAAPTLIIAGDDDPSSPPSTALMARFLRTRRSTWSRGRATSSCSTARHRGPGHQHVPRRRNELRDPANPAETLTGTAACAQDRASWTMTALRGGVTGRDEGQPARWRDRGAPRRPGRSTRMQVSPWSTTAARRHASASSCATQGDPLRSRPRHARHGSRAVERARTSPQSWCGTTTAKPR